MNSFDDFLINTPILQNESLFLEYYSMAAIFNDPSARYEMKLPDLKPLPAQMRWLDVL